MILHDPRLRAAFIATMVLSGLVALVTQVVDEDIRFPIVVGLIMFMSLVQMSILFLWADSPQMGITAARRLYMLGRFEETAEMLEQMVEAQPTSDALALLGNTYRQLKRLPKSEARLRAAVELAPDDKLSLYGLGKTLLTVGEYEEAAIYISRALDNDARKAVRVDLAQALYYAGRDPQEVLATARQAARVLNLEQYRTLFVNYLLYNLEQEDQDVSKRIIHANAEGIAYWQSEARRFADMDYGRRVAGDVVSIKAILDEDVSEDE